MNTKLIVGVDVSSIRRGWKQISNYLDCSPSTARRWAKHNGLPVKNPAGRKVTASPEDLDAWLMGEYSTKGAK